MEQEVPGATWTARARRGPVWSALAGHSPAAAAAAGRVVVDPTSAIAAYAWRAH